MYNPQAHQWSQTYADGKTGVLTTPSIGSFSNGRGELYSQESVDGRSILVRGIWSEIAANSHHFEISYSDDGGKTWVPAFIASLTRAR
jgi:Neuraminidase (sialidase)